jgi:hypothetical protein
VRDQYRVDAASACRVRVAPEILRMPRVERAERDLRESRAAEHHDPVEMRAARRLRPLEGRKGRELARLVEFVCNIDHGLPVAATQALFVELWNRLGPAQRRTHQPHQATAVRLRQLGEPVRLLERRRPRQYLARNAEVFRMIRHGKEIQRRAAPDGFAIVLHRLTAGVSIRVPWRRGDACPHGIKRQRGVQVQVAEPGAARLVPRQRRITFRRGVRCCREHTATDKQDDDGTAHADSTQVHVSSRSSVGEACSLQHPNGSSSRPPGALCGLGRCAVACEP